MKEERMKILKMVEEGKISPEKAAELLKELESTEIKPKKDKKKKYLRIYVDSQKDNERVNIKIPLSLIKIMKYMKFFVPKKVKENEEVKNTMDVLNGIDWKEILDELESGEELITVEGEGEVVRIWIE